MLSSGHVHGIFRSRASYFDDVGVVCETHALCQGGKERNVYCRFKSTLDYYPEF